MLTPEAIEEIMVQIEATRAENNRHFMKAWRLMFKVAPVEAAQIQADIRRGDMKISELNGKLAAQ